MTVANGRLRDCQRQEIFPPSTQGQRIHRGFDSYRSQSFALIMQKRQVVKLACNSEISPMHIKTPEILS